MNRRGGERGEIINNYLSNMFYHKKFKIYKILIFKKFFVFSILRIYVNYS